MPKRVLFSTIVVTVLAASIVSTGCAGKDPVQKLEYPMGDKITVGPLTYNVIETTWRSQLGSEFKVRIPQQRFLMISISCTNSAARKFQFRC